MERQDTLSKITKEVNAFYGTDYDYVTMAKINKIKDPDKINVGDLIQIGTIDENGTIWKPAYEEGVVNNDYWNQLEEDQHEITHYHRRVFEDQDLPKSVAALDRDEEGLWELVKGDAVAHNIGTTGNIDYRGRGPRANQQVIYDKNGYLVTTPENGGSYDYEKPSILNLYKYHLKVDVAPWLEYGNSPIDMTTKEKRVKAMSKTWTGQKGLIELGYEKDEKTGKWIQK